MTQNKPAAELPATPREYSALIGDRLIPAAERDTLKRRDPGHNHLVSLYPKATAEDLAAALAQARKAFDEGPWPRMSGAERAKIMLKVAQLIDANRAEFCLIECLEAGKPIGLVDREIGGTIAHWEYAATLARHCYGDTYDSLGNDALGMIWKNPVGVVSIITPWNYPLMINSQKVPFALAVGCTMVVKPSEMASGSALRLGELLLEAGVPPGVVNIIAGTGADLGEGMCTAPEVDMISFTGSTAVGRKIAEQAGRTLKRVSLELGGKSAHIVCADSDLTLAAEKVALGFTRNAGQACVGGSRLVVDRSIAEQFCEDVKRHVETLKIGDPLDPETTMGPLVSDVQKARVESYLAAGEEAGLARWTMATEAEPNPHGHFVIPSIFDDVPVDLSVAQEEIFGPVLAVQPFDSFDEAVRIANSTPYGLAAGVWTRNIDTALQFGRKLAAGTVEVNTFLAGAPELPITGHRDSGVGHERGRNAVDEFTELKTFMVQLGTPG